ncbi:hypothetical protein Tsubulata_014344 [Turnera subulata]|uniref:Uncharacterized protein n=1 Tax=Turnera subulata TaxID=218843 RepID=A0A9Q0F4S9_9ROSI|nr:hypothetical protein Tsubulata_014344 [Turnera subulata]
MKDMNPNKKLNKGAWTEEEDRKLAEVIAIHGAKRWKTVAAKAALNRGGKSCRLRWLNYLRPNIKRGNISDQEEDLIVRLHKLLGNRQSPKPEKNLVVEAGLEARQENPFNCSTGGEDSTTGFNVDDFFDFSNEDPLNLEWISQFLGTDNGKSGMS